MKVVLKEQIFKPITLTIILESHDEVQELYNRQNVSNHVIVENCSSDLPVGSYHNHDCALLNVLDRILNNM